MGIRTHWFFGTVLMTVFPVLATHSEERSDRDLLATAESAGGFSTLLTAVRAAGLEETLRNGGPFTVFAPTDEAFAALPKRLAKRLLDPNNRDLLATVLEFHVVAGKVDASTALAAGSAASLMGDRLGIELRRGMLTVQGARVVKNDIATANGVIHVIDTVLLPEAAMDRARGISSQQVVELAIERGVPLFNEGQPAACAAVYEVAALSVLAGSEPPLSQATRAGLLSVLGSDETDPSARAWELRLALDRALVDWATATPESDTKADAVVDDFDTGSGGAWEVVNDTVMGGRSRSAIRTDGFGVGAFAGNVSLENNGGFASVRREIERGAFEGFAGVSMRVRGDGKTYRFNVSDRRGVTPDLYRSEFRTEEGEWIEVRLPFAEMERSVMGYRPPNAKPINPARIRSIGLSIGDKQEGAFRLEVDAIRLYR